MSARSSDPAIAAALRPRAPPITKTSQYVIVVHHPPDNAEAIFRAWAQLDMIAFACVARETGTTGTTPHLHVFAITPQSMAVSRFIQFIHSKFPSAHVEAAIGSIATNLHYARKEGNYEDIGLLVIENDDPTLDANGRKRKKDINEQYREAIQLARAGQVDKVEPAVRLRHYKALTDISNIVETSTEPLKRKAGLWIWGPVGTGKSTAVHDAFTQPGKWQMYAKPNSQWWDQYQGEQVIYIDEFTPETAHPYIKNHLKLWTDPSAQIVERKGSTAKIRPQVVLIVSNWPPEAFFFNPNRPDPTNLMAILKRFVVLHFDTFRKYSADDIYDIATHMPILEKYKDDPGLEPQSPLIPSTPHVPSPVITRRPWIQIVSQHQAREQALHAALLTDIVQAPRHQPPPPDSFEAPDSLQSKSVLQYRRNTVPTTTPVVLTENEGVGSFEGVGRVQNRNRSVMGRGAEVRKRVTLEPVPQRQLEPDTLTRMSERVLGPRVPVPMPARADRSVSKMPMTPLQKALDSHVPGEISTPVAESAERRSESQESVDLFPRPTNDWWRPYEETNPPTFRVTTITTMPDDDDESPTPGPGESMSRASSPEAAQPPTKTIVTTQELEELEQQLYDVNQHEALVAEAQALAREKERKKKRHEEEEERRLLRTLPVQPTAERYPMGTRKPKRPVKTGLSPPPSLQYRTVETRMRGPVIEVSDDEGENPV